jgi:hypothetical protein
MAWLECSAPRRSAGNCTRLASARLSAVLDVEESTPHGSAGGASRRPRVDSRDGHPKSALGRPSNPRRAPEVGNLGESVDRCQIHAAAAAAAVANVADLPHHSCEPDHGRRPVASENWIGCHPRFRSGRRPNLFLCNSPHLTAANLLGKVVVSTGWHASVCSHVGTEVQAKARHDRRATAA